MHIKLISTSLDKVPCSGSCRIIGWQVGYYRLGKMKLTDSSSKIAGPKPIHMHNMIPIIIRIYRRLLGRDRPQSCCS